MLSYHIFQIRYLIAALLSGLALVFLLALLQRDLNRPRPSEMEPGLRQVRGEPSSMGPFTWFGGAIVVLSAIYSIVTLLDFAGSDTYW